MFTDGKVTRTRGTKKPLQIAQEIARDNDVCFYLISSATEEVNAQMLAVGDPGQHLLPSDTDRGLHGQSPIFVRCIVRGPNHRLHPF
jgi:hypothetical protein